MAYHIAVVVGSLRRESFNRHLAQAVISLAPADFTFEFIDIGSFRFTRRTMTPTIRKPVKS